MLLDHALVTPDSARLIAVSVRKWPRLGLRDLSGGARVQTRSASILTVQMNHLLLLLLVTLGGA